MLNEVFISDTNCITPLGFDVTSNIQAIENGVSAITLHNDLAFSDKPFYGGIIGKDTLATAFASLETNQSYTHLEKMMILAMHPIVKSAPGKKSGFILSTTKGNISSIGASQLEEAYLGHLAKKIADYFNFKTGPIVISNACVSGILAIATAKRFVQSGLYDDVYVVAGDEFSKFVFSGFSSFQALSSGPCKPYAADRDGLNLGEAAAAVHVTSATTGSGDIKIVGDGAINDANHISGPSRTGEGLFRSIESAMKEANISHRDIDYISAHGTATLYNDEMESVAFTRAGLQQVPVNSFKAIFGHTLGASGLLETIIAIESARRNTLYKSIGYDGSEMPTPINVITQNSAQKINYFIKTASGFGGCNTAVIFEKI